ncbi:MAG: ABC transporter substrate-binding protein [Spirochaetes bacterium]|nr:ABC transporter substrate-binding protein [Spirochaetota bacterium]
MKIRPVSIIIAVFLFTVAFPALSQQTSYPLTVKDDTGNTVVLPAQPRRIVSLTLFTDEMLLAIVDRQRLIGVTTYAADPQISNVSDLAADIPNKLTMNVEIIISLMPDLVLVANWSDAGSVKQMRDAGVPVYLMASGLTVKAIEEKIDRLALMTGEPAKGRELIARMDARLAAVADRVAELSPEKRERVIDYSPWGTAQGRGSSWDEIIRRAGLIDEVADLTPDEWGQVPLSKEKILQLDPDILIVPGWIYNDPKGASAFYSQVMRDPALQGLAAVKMKKVYLMPENLKSAVSQYIASSVEWLARTAYPELFR